MKTKEVLPKEKCTLCNNERQVGRLYCSDCIKKYNDNRMKKYEKK